MPFKPAEIAVLNVKGRNFTDWESVEVKHVFQQPPFFTFRMTCSEPTPMGSGAVGWSKMQIVPGDECQITLAGQPAFGGLVFSRQVFYNASRHYIEIQGASNVMSLTTAAAVTQTHEFKNVDFGQLARALLSPTRVALEVVGGMLPTHKFDRVSIVPGTSIMDVLDIHARPLGIDFTSNVKGNLVAAMGPTGGGNTFTEGKDIIEGREIIYNPDMAQALYGVGQRTGNDQQYGPKVSHMPFFSKEGIESLGQLFLPQVHPAEIPSWSNAIPQGRVNTEFGWQQRDQVTVFVTVYGWTKADGSLWKENETYFVNSPMLIMDGSLPLTSRSVTFVQDNSVGTRTILELCNPAALQGLIPRGSPGSTSEG